MSAWPPYWLNWRRVAALALVGLTFWLIRSFIVPLTWAAIFSIANWRLYSRCAKHVPPSLRAHLLPFAFSILITFLVLGPVIFAFGVLAEQSQGWLSELSLMDKGGLAAPAWIEAIPVVGARLAHSWNESLAAPGGVSAILSRIKDDSLVYSFQSVGHFIAYHAFVVSITVVTLVVSFRQGEVLAESLTRRIDELFGLLGERIVSVAIAALRATVQSMVLVGLLDGIAMGIIYSTAHTPAPVEWAAVTGMLAMVPFLGYFAVAAVCVAQIAHHATGSALAVGAVGFGVLFLNDKFARPILMTKGSGLDFLGALMGTVGGLQSFGLLGIFLGPVIVAVGKSIFDEWLSHTGAGLPNTGVAGAEQR